MTLSITIFNIPSPVLVWDICPSVVGHASVGHNVSMFICLVVCATVSIVTGPTSDSWIYDGISLDGGGEEREGLEVHREFCPGCSAARRAEEPNSSCFHFTGGEKYYHRQRREPTLLDDITDIR